MLDTINLNYQQLAVVESPVSGSLFLSGPYSSGKTSSALFRIRRLLEEYPANRFLILAPQSSLADPYRQLFTGGTLSAHTRPEITTMSGLCRQSVNLFWPAIAKKAGFKDPSSPPHFLSLETAQYCLGTIVDPLLDDGYFQSIKIERNRLLSQILDNLNKTAINNLPISEIYPRLSSISTGLENLDIPFTQAQECALAFRAYCLEHNLVDFSLLLHLFSEEVMSMDLFHKYLFGRYDILIADNLEEDTAFTHTFIRRTIAGFKSSLLITDTSGGYRTFLGADPKSAYELKEICDVHFSNDDEIGLTADLTKFRAEFRTCIRKSKTSNTFRGFPEGSQLHTYQFYPQMVIEVARQIKTLVDAGTAPKEIAVLSPYLSDSLKFNLTRSLNELGLPVESIRPSRSYISAAPVQALVLFGRLAHPGWQMPLTILEFRHMLMEILPDIDLIRADIITRALFVASLPENPLRPFDELTNADLQQRITYAHGGRMMQLFDWLNDYLGQDLLPLDIFFQKAFGELLSQKDFAWFDQPEAGNSIAKLIQSIREFRFFIEADPGSSPGSAGLEYIKSLQNGLIPGSLFYPENPAEAVRISPAFTFLMQNRTVDYQFWLDIGSLGWWERLNQPLTNPYIFNAGWDASENWDYAADFNHNQDMMERTVSGLLSRCRKSFVAAAVEVNEFGVENRGPLLQAFQNYLRRSYKGAAGA